MLLHFQVIYRCFSLTWGQGRNYITIIKMKKLTEIQNGITIVEMKKLTEIKINKEK